MSLTNTITRRVEGQYAQGLKIAATRGRAPEHWTKDERDTLAALTSDGPQAVIARALEGSYVGRLMAAMTMLAHRGLINVEGGSIRVTNAGFGDQAKSCRITHVMRSGERCANRGVADVA